MTTEQELLLLIAKAKNISRNSSMEDLEFAEDYADQISDKADQLRIELMGDIYSAMEIRKHG